MYEMVVDFLRSGQTQREYSLKAGIGRAKFNYWVCKYRVRHQNPAIGFVQIETGPQRQQQDLEVLYPNGVKVKATGADLSLISQLIHLY